MLFELTLKLQVFEIHSKPSMSVQRTALPAASASSTEIPNVSNREGALKNLQDER